MARPPSLASRASRGPQPREQPPPRRWPRHEPWPWPRRRRPSRPAPSAWPRARQPSPAPDASPPFPEVAEPGAAERRGPREPSDCPPLRTRCGMRGGLPGASRASARAFARPWKPPWSPSVSEFRVDKMCTTRRPGADPFPRSSVTNRCQRGANVDARLDSLSCHSLKNDRDKAFTQMARSFFTLACAGKGKHGKKRAEP